MMNKLLLSILLLASFSKLNAQDYSSGISLNAEKINATGIFLNGRLMETYNNRSFVYYCFSFHYIGIIHLSENNLLILKPGFLLAPEHFYNAFQIGVGYRRIFANIVKIGLGVNTDIHSSALFDFRRPNPVNGTYDFQLIYALGSDYNISLIYSIPFSKYYGKDFADNVSWRIEVDYMLKLGIEIEL